VDTSSKRSDNSKRAENVENVGRLVSLKGFHFGERCYGLSISILYYNYWFNKTNVFKPKSVVSI
jgi:hypothetical protein